jgi:putative membrane protein
MESMRDKLALERTKLANERTFLAYVRTSLSLVAGAAVLFQFFSAVHAYVAVAWILAVTGILVLAIGIYRFRAVRAELRGGMSVKEDTWNNAA